MHDFTKIEYLKKGTPRQKKVFQILDHINILDMLKAYDSILVGSLPLNLDLQDSDLDLICHYKNKRDFIRDITSKFGMMDGFILEESEIYNIETVIATFSKGGFIFEIFGQEIPTKNQMGYQHLIIEYKLLNDRGEQFRIKIKELKKKGVKTEQAFCDLLGILGNPYLGILTYKLDSLK